MATATHRLVMMRYLGRKLLSNEWVHHIDGNRKNNTIENLQVVSPREHILLHPKPSQKGTHHNHPAKKLGGRPKKTDSTV